MFSFGVGVDKSCKLGPAIDLFRVCKCNLGKNRLTSREYLLLTLYTSSQVMNTILMNVGNFKHAPNVFLFLFIDHRAP